MSIFNLPKKDLSYLQNLTVHSTYDQFIQLRDTLVKTGKKYAGKYGWKLIIDPENGETIEAQERCLYKQGIQPNKLRMIGSYISPDENTPFQAVVKKAGWYRLIHKEEILLNEDTNKVYCYIEYRHWGDDGWEAGIPVAVFDREGVSEDEPLGNSIKKMTSFGYIEMNLYPEDLLILKLVDQDGNDLTLQNDSNFWSIEYLDLPYKE